MKSQEKWMKKKNFAWYHFLKKKKFESLNTITIKKKLIFNSNI